MTATNIQAAERWFLSNASGSLTCRGADGAVADAECYPDAVTFFKEHGEKA